MFVCCTHILSRAHCPYYALLPLARKSHHYLQLSIVDPKDSRNTDQVRIRGLLLPISLFCVTVCYTHTQHTHTHSHTHTFHRPCQPQKRASSTCTYPSIPVLRYLSIFYLRINDCVQISCVCVYVLILRL